MEKINEIIVGLIVLALFGYILLELVGTEDRWIRDCRIRNGSVVEMTGHCKGTLPLFPGQCWECVINNPKG
jgi:hypothetical protein